MADTGAKQQIAANLARVLNTIDSAAQGRDVQLGCVTKYASDSNVRHLLAAGARHIAENLLPRAAERMDQFQSEGFSFTRHLIGPPQSRKIPLIPSSFDLVHAVDREKVVRILASEQEKQFPGQRLDILLQVNIGREKQKHGFAPDRIDEAAAQVVEEFPALRLRGVMAVPPWPDAYGSDLEFERETRRYFVRMREIFDKIRARYPGEPAIDTLSLGMSQDYVWAVEEGATMVRVGSALFEGVSEG